MRPHALGAALLLAFAAAAVAYQRVVPLFEAPDEQSHIHYVAFVGTFHRLPRYGDEPEVPGEGMQPPLYYAAVAPLFAALVPRDPALLEELGQASRALYGQAPPLSSGGRIRRALGAGGARIFRVLPGLETLRRLRWGSLGCGLLAVGLTFTAARRASGSSRFAALSAALLAFNPQFLFVSAYVNNDVAGAALGAAGFWLFTRALDAPAVTRRDYALGALLLAVGAATKTSTLPALGATFLALAALDGRPLRARLADAGLAAGLLALLLAPLVGTNLARAGDASGLAAVWASAAELRKPADFGGVLPYLVHEYSVWTFQSYWARFGWMNVQAPAFVYAGTLALTAVGTLGFAWASLRGEGGRESALLRYLAAAVLATLGTHVLFNTQVVAAQGRHLFGAAPQLAALLAAGISFVATRQALCPGGKTLFAVAGGLAALAVYCVAGVLAPAYG